MHETPPSPAVPSDLVARTLRHEVGDLLQSIYSTVAIMQRLLAPEAERERRLLADLRLRAEICRDQIDAAHDLLRPHDREHRRRHFRCVGGPRQRRTVHRAGEPDVRTAVRQIAG